MKLQSGAHLCWIILILMSLCVAPFAHAQTDKGKAAWKTYMDYRTALENAKSVDEVLSYFVQERAEEVKQTPEEDRAFIFEMMQMMNQGMTDLKAVSEEWDGENNVVFKVTGKQKEDESVSELEGKVGMTKEGDAWKVGKESFTVKSE